MALENASLIEYPCDFPIKIMGRTQAGFAQAVLDIVRAHAPDFDGATMEMRTSKGGKYLSLTCTVRATSRDRGARAAPSPNPRPAWVSIKSRRSMGHSVDFRPRGP